VMLRGRISPQEMPNYYSAADVFVSGSQSEGTAEVVIEAMSAGMVPVVSDIPSFRAIVGDCGARFPGGDAAAFAAALRRICSGDLVSLKAATKARFDDSLTWDAIGNRTVAEYQSVLAARRSA
jgi:glycosyltransferase involved in cell wall biosynthesis